MHPEDLIIYTALVLIIKDDLEKSRISRRAKRVFSYRVNSGRPNRLYDVRGAYDAYLTQLKRKAEKLRVKFVSVADIADFFPRIYQHRLQNVIESTASNQRGIDVARVLVKKLICKLMGGNSYGIPVGPYASRILGEAVLIDVDSHLQSLGIDYVRWVDDYNIFSNSEYLAQSTVFELAEWLFDNHGLTRQSSKTKILPSSRYIEQILTKPEEKLTPRDNVIALLRGSEYDDDDNDGDPDPEEVQYVLDQLHAYDLHAMLMASISDEELVDYQIVRYVLTRLPRIPGVEDEQKKEILDLIIDNAKLFYPVSVYVAQYVLSFRNLSKQEKSKIGKRLLRPLKSRRNRPPEYYAMWILHIFSTSSEWVDVREIVNLYQGTTSEVIKRFAAIAISVCGSRAEALAMKSDLSRASSLLRLAILCASKKLGKDERKHWKLSNQTHGILEKTI